MTMVERAIALAVRVHAGQKRKNGDPYIFHPLRVMLSVDTRGHDPELVRATAVTHDVREEGGTDEQIMEAGLEACIPHLRLLTRKPGEPYGEYVERLSHDAVARRVKLADLHDNMNLSEIPCPNLRDYDRHRKYERYQKMLEARDQT